MSALRRSSIKDICKNFLSCGPASLHPLSSQSPNLSHQALSIMPTFWHPCFPYCCVLLICNPHLDKLGRFMLLEEIWCCIDYWSRMQTGGGAGGLRGQRCKQIEDVICTYAILRTYPDTWLASITPATAQFLTEPRSRSRIGSPGTGSSG